MKQTLKTRAAKIQNENMEKCYIMKKYCGNRENEFI